MAIMALIQSCRERGCLKPIWTTSLRLYAQRRKLSYATEAVQLQPLLNFWWYPLVSTATAFHSLEKLVKIRLASFYLHCASDLCPMDRGVSNLFGEMTEWRDLQPQRCTRGSRWAHEKAETMGVVHVQITHAPFIAAASIKSDFRFLGCGVSHNKCGGRK